MFLVIDGFINLKKYMDLFHGIWWFYFARQCFVSCFLFSYPLV